MWDLGFRVELGKVIGLMTLTPRLKLGRAEDLSMKRVLDSEQTQAKD